jgi:hypothetical protein
MTGLSYWGIRAGQRIKTKDPRGGGRSEEKRCYIVSSKQSNQLEIGF